jgi:hypothetical protein
MYQHLPLQDPTKLNLIVIFGLATLLSATTKHELEQKISNILYLLFGQGDHMV